MRCFSKCWRYPTGHRANGEWISERIYAIWKAMLARCNNPKNDRYKNYGARGITVCEEWLSYDAFYEWAMANGYDDTLTIERKNVNGNYEPSNCEWISKEDQLRNTTRSVKVGGKCLSQIAKDAGIEVHTVQYRHSVGKPLTAPVRDYAKRECNGKSLKQIANETGISINTLIYRWKAGKREYKELTAPTGGA